MDSIDSSVDPPRGEDVRCHVRIIMSDAMSYFMLNVISDVMSCSMYYFMSDVMFRKCESFEFGKRCLLAFISCSLI